MELPKRYRPRKLDQVRGQPQAVLQLEAMIAKNQVKHVMAFIGPSGCGKTTLARIMARAVGCGPSDITEVNCADLRGIDNVRDIRNQMPMSPLGGKAKAWILDEIHRTTSDSQAAMLKLLEDTPDHCYFMLATTDFNKLLPTIRNRCTKIELRSVPAKEIRTLLKYVCGKEQITLSEQIEDRIVESAEGAPRSALVLLDQIKDIKDPAEQLNIVASTSTKTVAWDVVQGLLWRRDNWMAMAKKLKALQDEDWEGIRRLILANATNEMLKAGKTAARAAFIVTACRDAWYECGKAGLVAACYEVLARK